MLVWRYSRLSKLSDAISRANEEESVVTRVAEQPSVGPRTMAHDGPIGKTNLATGHVEGLVSANSSFAGGSERKGDEGLLSSSGSLYFHGAFPDSRSPVIQPDLAGVKK